MSKNTTEEGKVEAFMNATLKVGTNETPVKNAVVVKEVTPDVGLSRMIIFETTQKTVKFMQKMLKAPERFVQFVYHAVMGEKVESQEPAIISPVDSDDSSLVVSENSINKDSLVDSQLSVANDNAGKSEEHELAKVLSWSASEILKHIFTEKAMSDFGLDSYKDAGYAKVSNCHTQRSTPSAQIKAGKYGLVQLVFSHPEQIRKILAGEQGPINNEDDIEAEEIKDIGKNIFSVKQADKAVDTVFNVGVFKQMLQHNIPELSNVDTAPVFAQVDGNTYSVSLNLLKKYVGHHASEIIFNPEVSGDQQVYRPIGIPQKEGMFSEISGASMESDASKKALFHIIIDVSDSMKSNLSNCVEKLKSVLQQITESTENWTIVLTDFNHESRSKSFDSDTDTLQNLNSHLEGFAAGGKTKLYGTMYEQFDKILQVNDGYNSVSSVAAIIFTDGRDNKSEGIDSEAVKDSVLQSRDRVENLQIFTVELGKSNAEFFTQLAEEAGCTHIKLDNIEQFAQLEQYAGSLAEKSHVLSFIDESLKTYRQVMVEGEISVNTHTIPENKKVTVHGVEYSISQPTLTSQVIEEYFPAEEAAVLGATDDSVVLLDL